MRPDTHEAIRLSSRDGVLGWVKAERDANGRTAPDICAGIDRGDEDEIRLGATEELIYLLADTISQTH